LTKAIAASTVSATAVDVAGSVFLVGSFRNAVVLGGTTLTGLEGYDVFVAKFNPASNQFVWAQRAGGTGNDEPTALAVSGTSVYVAGSFTSPAAGFGTNTPINPYPNTSVNNTTLGYLASLTDPTLTATAAAALLRETAALFPNPARHTAILRRPTGAPGAPLTLTDALGRAVRRYPAPAGPNAVLNLGGLPAGLYLLRGAGPAQRLVAE